MDKKIRTILSGVEENIISESEADALLKAEHNTSVNKLTRKHIPLHWSVPAVLILVVLGIFLATPYYSDGITGNIVKEDYVIDYFEENQTGNYSHILEQIEILKNKPE